ncbi:sulfite exporter TauE/SafE family protein [Spirosoma montaniterrae]|uniref:Urease accessory protein UreH-like transmembrane domain-containing protein n=1 Tax=Spirosoma montaniterrae TaxID=1178516 RepID=A0A1P9WU48_9BACT|nr:sulfite exporter TauE/SafE family protein [Spirosoma montaniterrae]AQG78916.1 hypothetical protein AWR27_05985 [Spirosoma montaniterrae]
MSAWLLTALLAGVAGSLHCVGMCGPLAAALPVGRLPQAQRGIAVGLYHAGRLLAYAALGLVLGSVGHGLLLAGLQQPLAIGAGLLLLVWPIVTRSRFGGLTALRPMRWLSVPMARLFQSPSLTSFGLLGVLNGLLPCGMVYVALAGAVVTGSAPGSATYMVLFGLGTVPALVLVRFVPAFFSAGLRRQLSRLTPLVTVGLGILLLGRGLYQPTLKSDTKEPITICHGGR